MSTQANAFSELLKKPGFTLGVSLLAGFGIGYLYERNKGKQQLKQKARNQNGSSPIRNSGILKHHTYGDLPPELAANIEELSEQIKAFLTMLEEKKAFEEIIPRSFTSDNDLRSVWSSLEYAENQNDLSSVTKGFSSPLFDMIDRGGQRWRPLLCSLLAQAFTQKIDEEVIQIASLMEIIQSGLTMLDDFKSQNLTRKGKPAIHLLHSADITINSGCFMFFVSWFSFLKRHENKLSSDKVLKLMKFYLQEMTNLHLGYAWDVYWNKKLEEIPSELEYLQMEIEKSGAITHLAAKFTSEVLRVPRQTKYQILKWSEKIGLALKIRGDAKNLSNGLFKTNEEGNLNLALVHSLKNGQIEDQERLLELLKGERNKEHNDEIINILTKNDSINYAKNKADQLVQEAWDQVKDFIPNNKFKGHLKTFAETFAITEA